MRIKSWTIAALLIASMPFCAHAQLSLSTAIDLALRSSPQVRIAQADVAKAQASLSQAVGAYIPVISANGGIGESYGVPLSLPVVFSIAAQSLAFNFSQPDYIRAAKSGVVAANFALDAAREAVVEDTIATYITLDNAERRKATLGEIAGIAARLQQITEDRYNVGADPHSEVTKSHRTAVQMRLQMLQVNDEIETLADHLGHLTGMPGSLIQTSHASIPLFPGTQIAALSHAANTAGVQAESYAVQAAFASAQAKAYQAHGDKRYMYLPQVAFGAGYSRVNTVGSHYSDYYPGFETAVSTRNQQGNFNTLNSLDVGVQVSVPILDYIHRAKARESAADAMRALAEAQNARIQFGEGQLKLAHAEAELSARAELASLDRDLAQDQLDAVLLQLQASAANAQAPGATPLNPKDEQNARLQERERYLDMLAAELQLQTTQVNVLQQSGGLGTFVQRSLPTAGAVTPPTGGAGTVSPVMNAPIPVATPRP